MKAHILLAVSLALGGQIGASRADEVASGREFYELHCHTCHGGSAPADSPIGPRLTGIIGSKAGTQTTGIHSRAVIDSSTVWNRESLRRFLSNPSRELPGTIMPARVDERAALERLLDYLESL